MRLIRLLLRDILFATLIQCFPQLRLLSRVSPRKTASSSNFKLSPSSETAMFSAAVGRAFLRKQTILFFFLHLVLVDLL